MAGDGKKLIRPIWQAERKDTPSKPLMATLLVCDSCGRLYGCWILDYPEACENCFTKNVCTFKNEELVPNGTCKHCWKPKRGEYNESDKSYYRVANM